MGSESIGYEPETEGAIDSEAMRLFNNIIIPRAWMGSESMAHEAKAESAIDSEAMRAREIIVLVKSNQLVKNIEKKSFS